MSADGGTPESPHDAAIDWVVRKKEGALSRKEQAAFEAWLAADPAHAAAYDDIEQLAADLSELRAPHQANPPPRAPAETSTRISRGLRRHGRLALPLPWRSFRFFALRLLHGHGRNAAGDSRRRLARRAQRQIGHRPSLRPFAATSRPSAREAWFDVAPNQARPFAVEAAGGTVTALGTSFDIALEKGEAQVTVTKHRVAVASGGQETVVAEAQQTASIASTITGRSPAAFSPRAPRSKKTIWPTAISSRTMSRSIEPFSIKN